MYYIGFILAHYVACLYHIVILTIFDMLNPDMNILHISKVATSDR